MAYSDGIRKQRFNPDTAADLFDALLVSKDVMLEQNSAQTTASATPATISGLSQAVTIASGEQVKLTFQGSFSAATAGHDFTLYMQQNGVTVESFSWISEDTDTAGKDEYITWSYLLTAPATGSVTYRVQWSADDSSDWHMRKGKLFIEVRRRS